MISMVYLIVWYMKQLDKTWTTFTGCPVSAGVIYIVTLCIVNLVQLDYSVIPDA